MFQVSAKGLHLWSLSQWGGHTNPAVWLRLLPSVIANLCNGVWTLAATPGAQTADHPGKSGVQGASGHELQQPHFTPGLPPHWEHPAVLPHTGHLHWGLFGSQHVPGAAGLCGDHSSSGQSPLPHHDPLGHLSHGGTGQDLGSSRLWGGRSTVSDWHSGIQC